MDAALEWLWTCGLSSPRIYSVVPVTAFVRFVMPLPLPSPFLVFKVTIAVAVIVGASWLSGKKPYLAGFITALPIVSIIALAFSYIEHKDVAATAAYARGIILAVPVSWLFFLPFFFTEKWNLGFWISYGLGLALLCAGYFLHQAIMRNFNA